MFKQKFNQHKYDQIIVNPNPNDFWGISKKIESSEHYKQHENRLETVGKCLKNS